MLVRSRVRWWLERLEDNLDTTPYHRGSYRNRQGGSSSSEEEALLLLRLHISWTPNFIGLGGWRGVYINCGGIVVGQVEEHEKKTCLASALTLLHLWSKEEVVDITLHDGTWGKWANGQTDEWTKGNGPTPALSCLTSSNAFPLTSRLMRWSPALRTECLTFHHSLFSLYHPSQSIE